MAALFRFVHGGQDRVFLQFGRPCEALRKACETSLTATAIRYACLTRDGAAVILSSGETIEYRFMSEGLKEAKGISWTTFSEVVDAGARSPRHPGRTFHQVSDRVI